MILCKAGFFLKKIILAWRAQNVMWLDVSLLQIVTYPALDGSVKK